MADPIVLSDDIDAMLTDLSKATGRSRSELAEQAIQEFLSEQIDIEQAENSLDDIKAGAPTVSLKVLVEKYGLDR